MGRNPRRSGIHPPQPSSPPPRGRQKRTTRHPRLPFFRHSRAGGNPRGPGIHLHYLVPRLRGEDESEQLVIPASPSRHSREGGNPRGPGIHGTGTPPHHIPSYKSAHTGLPSSINRTFHARFHFLRAFSLTIALSIVSWTSYQTSLCTP